MELSRDGQNRELKLHGTYGFPVYVDRKCISSYPTGFFPWHWHDEIELTLVVSGEMEYRVNDSCYRLQEGQGLFCNSEALHFGRRMQGDCDYISITFHPRLLAGFDGSTVGTKYVYPLVGALASFKLSPLISWQKAVLEDIQRVYQMCMEKPALYELDVQILFWEIWREVYANCAEQAESAPSEDPEKLKRLRAMLAFLHEHYAERVTLEALSRHVGLCKSECCRFFKRQMRVSPFEYLLDYRVGRSLAFLQEGYSVSQAAEAAGFSDPSYFAKVFRLRTGRSPSSYRKEAREGEKTDMQHQNLHINSKTVQEGRQ
ncbi:AraC family transcriptional regulator [Acutalibacter sp. 1XD8-33]|uniref:AraC family transcriptional regulator n=1 Tax=Acutalibacter sp. 1XD8-33 TaxID=2320081 RepID=UPI00131413B8|nr:AraC family transcriptional regulator [Acutalibacter sp. 1XD8-33]